MPTEPTEGGQVPMGPEISLGTIPEVEEEAGGAFIERSWGTVDFTSDPAQYGTYSSWGVTIPSSVVPS